MSGRKRTGTQDLRMKKLIFDLEKMAKQNKASIWNKVAEELSKPSRSKRIANLTQIDKHSNDGEVVIVPGKVLSFGKLTHKVKVVASSFSQSALKKISEQGGSALTLEEFVKENPKGTGARIVVE